MARYTNQATPVTYGARCIIKTVESTLGRFTLLEVIEHIRSEAPRNPTMHNKGVTPILLNDTILFLIMGLNLLIPHIWSEASSSTSL
jgi:hypothetical protein